MNSKSFIAVGLTVIIAISILVVVSKQPQTELQADKNHFSVKWMGFAPADYDNTYPEYYIAINNLADETLRMQIALQIKNQEANAFYFKVDQFSSPPSGWSIVPMAVGIVQVDETKSFVYDQAFRTRPTAISEGRLTESINLVVQAYYDSDYTSLYSQDNFSVTFNFLDVTSSAWTVLSHDDFEDGQTHGWSSGYEGTPGQESYYGASLTVSDTEYRSIPKSLRLTAYVNWWSIYCYAYYEKNFNVDWVQEAYLIYSIRSEDWTGQYREGVKINGTTYFRSDNDSLEKNAWFQVALKLKRGQVNNVQIWAPYASASYPNGHDEKSSYLDDAYVIVKY